MCSNAKIDRYINGKRTIAEDFVSLSGTLFAGIGATTEEGGAVKISQVKNIDIRYCLFRDDIALSGGGIYASNSTVHLFSTCFDGCRGDRTDRNDGGNAIAFMSSPLFTELVSASRCAPQVRPCGDGAFNGDTSPIRGFNLNFSYCLGHSGECCVGIRYSTNSVIKYMNVVNCHQSSLIWMEGSFCHNSNFFDNILGAYYAYGKMKYERCYFFGNSKDKNDAELSSYVDCFGDIIRNNLIITESTSLILTKIMFHKCDFYPLKYTKKCRVNSLLQCICLQTFIL